MDAAVIGSRAARPVALQVCAVIAATRSRSAPTQVLSVVISPWGCLRRSPPHRRARRTSFEPGQLDGDVSGRRRRGARKVRARRPGARGSRCRPAATRTSSRRAAWLAAGIGRVRAQTDVQDLVAGVGVREPDQQRSAAGHRRIGRGHRSQSTPNPPRPRRGTRRPGSSRPPPARSSPLDPPAAPPASSRNASPTPTAAAS